LGPRDGCRQVTDLVEQTTRFTRKVLAFTRSRARLVILVTAVVSLGFAIPASKISLNASLDELFPVGSEIVQRMVEYGQTRDERDLLFIGLDADDPYTLERLQAVGQAARGIATLPQVRGVITPFNVPTFANRAGRVVIVPLLPRGEAPTDAAAARDFRLLAAQTGNGTEFVMTPDGASLALLVNAPGQSDPRAFLAQLEPHLEPLREQFSVHLAGPMTFEAATARHLSGELPTLLIGALLVIILIYYLAFRSLAALLLPLLVPALATLWTTGTMVLVGLDLNIVTSLAPPFVLILGSAYSGHVLNAYVAPLNRGSIHGRVASVLATIVLASLTSIAGFASLATGVQGHLREFGLATSVGITYSAVLAILFLPACIDGRRPRRANRAAVNDRFMRLAAGLGRGIQKHRAIVMGVAGIVVVLFATLLPRLRYETDLISMFPDGDIVIDDNRHIAARFGGLDDVNLTITAAGEEAGFFLQPEVLEQLAQFEQRVAAEPSVVAVSSIVTLMSRLNLAATGKFELPSNRAVLLLFARMYRAFADLDQTGAITAAEGDLDFSRVTINVRFAAPDELFGSREHTGTVLARIDELADEMLATDLGDRDMWSWVAALVKLPQIMIRDQLVAAAAALVLVFTMAAVGFRSVLIGGLVLVPMVAGVMLNFIPLAIARMRFDAVSVMFTSVAVGVGVDHAIHFLLQFRLRWRAASRLTATPSLPDLITETLVAAGRPIAFNAVAMVGGLLVLLLSSFQPIVQLGLLLATSVAATTVGSLLLLPVVLNLTFGWSARERAAMA
jgi:predicted RND superfamily exporter protein